jgi:hypothetical protein
VTRQRRIVLLLAVAAISAFGVCLLPAIPQDPAYHDFADKRPFLGIPNFGDVSSNIAFVIAGFAGMASAWKNKADVPGYRIWLVFFIGVLLTGFGSAYYHLAPDSHRLVWDRLPMTVAFMALFSLLIAERVHHKAGILLLPVLLAAGAGSVFYWNRTDDLRPYAFVQFFPIFAMLLIIRLFPARHGGTKYLLYTFGWYALAKLLEHFDKAFFDLAGGLISGHTLKHLAAATGTACMIGYMKRLKNPA